MKQLFDYTNGDIELLKQKCDALENVIKTMDTGIDNLTLSPLAKKILMCNSSDLDYAQNCKDPELKKLCKEAAERHQEHFNTIFAQIQ